MNSFVRGRNRGLGDAAEMIASALETNTSLNELDLSGNGIGLDVCKVLIQAASSRKQDKTPSIKCGSANAFACLKGNIDEEACCVFHTCGGCPEIERDGALRWYGLQRAWDNCFGDFVLQYQHSLLRCLYHALRCVTMSRVWRHRQAWIRMFVKAPKAIGQALSNALYPSADSDHPRKRLISQCCTAICMISVGLWVSAVVILLSTGANGSVATGMMLPLALLILNDPVRGWLGSHFDDPKGLKAARIKIAMLLTGLLGTLITAVFSPAAGGALACLITVMQRLNSFGAASV